MALHYGEVNNSMMDKILNLIIGIVGMIGLGVCSIMFLNWLING